MSALPTIGAVIMLLAVAKCLSFPLMHLPQRRMLLLRRFFSSQQWSYEVETRLSSPTENQTVLELLVSTKSFPSSSQARRACKFGRVLLLDASAGEEDVATNAVDWKLPLITISNSSIIAKASTNILPGQRIVIVTRTKDNFYPTSVTGYIAPPTIESSIPRVVYQDDEIAVIDKPENLTTIAGGESTSRNDLQSVLPFILTPPPLQQSNRKKVPLPRPVHRLDRRTSGLVLVAKTDAARKRFSQAFADRLVRKTYTAIVIGKPSSDDHGHNNDSDDNWNVIDYPIDGKEAVSSWRIISASSSKGLSLLEIRPKTGRYHQIRRHLGYCLGTPIVGDAKYDRGGDVAKSLRHDGMFLCSNALEIQYEPQQSSEDGACTSTENNFVATSSDGFFRVEIPLPSKFETMMKNITS